MVSPKGHICNIYIYIYIYIYILRIYILYIYIAHIYIYIYIYKHATEKSMKIGPFLLKTQTKAKLTKTD